MARRCRSWGLLRLLLLVLLNLPTFPLVSAVSVAVAWLEQIAKQIDVDPQSTGSDEVMVELRLDPAGGWKNLKLRVNSEAYPDKQQPSAVYPSSSDSRSRTATAARTTFERALMSAKADFTLTSMSELWVSSVVESIKAYGGGS